MCVCLWFSVLLYVYVVVSVSVPIKRKRLYESPRAVTRLTVYRPLRVRVQELVDNFPKNDIIVYFMTVF